jgi:hypothetical protein
MTTASGQPTTHWKLFNLVFRQKINNNRIESMEAKRWKPIRSWVSDLSDRIWALGYWEYLGGGFRFLLRRKTIRKIWWWWGSNNCLWLFASGNFCIFVIVVVARLKNTEPIDPTMQKNKFKVIAKSQKLRRSFFLLPLTIVHFHFWGF